MAKEKHVSFFFSVKSIVKDASHNKIQFFFMQHFKSDFTIKKYKERMTHFLYVSEAMEAIFLPSSSRMDNKPGNGNDFISGGEVANLESVNICLIRRESQ